MADEYKTPILASIFRGLGLLNLLAAVIFFLIAFVAITDARSSTDGRYLLGLFLPCVGALGSALILYGLGQVIEYIGQIAFYSQLSYQAIERQGNLAGHRGKEELAAISKLGDALERSLTVPMKPTGTGSPGAATSSPPPFPTAPTSTVPRFYYQSLEGEAVGPVNEAELRRLLEDSVISYETFVCPEGAEGWSRLEEILLP